MPRPVPPPGDVTQPPPPRPPRRRATARRTATDVAGARIAASLEAAWNARDIDAIVACYAPDYRGTDVGEATARQGVLDLRKTAQRTLRALPDLRITGDETVTQGACVVLIWTLRGTHQGPFLRVPPTGRAVTMHGMSRVIVQDGLITEGLRIWDVAGFLRAVGLLTDL